MKTLTLLFSAYPLLRKNTHSSEGSLIKAFSKLSKILLAFITLQAFSNTVQAQGLAKFYTSLYVVGSGGSMLLADGVANTYYPSYCNLVDEADAKKLISFNTKETISIVRDGEKLAVEKRVPIVDKDSIFLEIGEVYDKTYELSFLPKNFDPSLEAYLKDEFNGTVSAISLQNNDTTKYMFVASDAQPASKSANRFSVLFALPGTLPGILPVNFRTVKAFETGNVVNVEWNVENEMNVDHYTVERSKDGIHFTFIAAKDATTAQLTGKKYSLADVSPEAGTNYYRISNVNKNGTITYSKIVKVEIGNKNISSINAYPTVLTDGVFSLQFNNTTKGSYVLRVINTNGQLVFTKTINHSGGNATETIRMDRNIGKGMCQLNITGPNNNAFPSVKLINR